MAEEAPVPTAEQDDRKRAKLRREIGREFTVFWARLTGDSITRVRNISPDDWAAAQLADEGREQVGG